MVWSCVDMLESAATALSNANRFSAVSHEVGYCHNPIKFVLMDNGIDV